VKSTFKKFAYASAEEGGARCARHRSATVNGTRKTLEESICEKDEFFKSVVKGQWRVIHDESEGGDCDEVMRAG